jgi:hypothetical protein
LRFGLNLKGEEISAAEELPCLLHGNRIAEFSKVDCNCFPPDEPPSLVLKAELDAAKAVRCPLHGARFSKLAREIYRAGRNVRPAHLQPESCLAWRSDRYIKALKASFPPDRWPPKKVIEADGSVRFLLKDGTEIHRIGPPPEILEY